MSILPDAIRIIPRHKYCPIKKGDHNSCCTILTLSQDGTISISGLSNNHPNNKHTQQIRPNTSHKALSKVLKLVWGPLGWRLAFNERYLMVLNGDKNIVDITDDEEGCPSADFRSETEMRKMFRGKIACCGLQEEEHDDDEEEADEADDTSESSNSSLVSPKSGKSKKPTPLWKTNLSPFDLWLNWNKRRLYKEVIFRPGGSTNEDGFFKMRSGFGVVPKGPSEGAEEVARRMREHLFNVICSRNDEFNTFFIELFQSFDSIPMEKVGRRSSLPWRKGFRQICFD